MRLKKLKKTKNKLIQYRCTDDDYNAVLRKAQLYTEGNIAEWALYAAINFVPSKDDLEEPQKKRKKK